MNSLFEYLVAASLIVILALLANPFMFWMPSTMLVTALALAAVLVAIYAGFVLKEQAGDERELFHRMFAGRVAFLASVAVLTLALLVEGLHHSIDPWIPAALAVTVLAKILTRIWANRNR